MTEKRPQLTTPTDFLIFCVTEAFICDMCSHIITEVFIYKHVH